MTGFFAGRSHRIVPCADCKLQPDWMNALAARACTLLEENGITAYNEETHTGRCAIYTCVRAGTAASACCALW